MLVINCGGDGGRLRELIAASEVTGVRQIDVAAPRFNKPLALNIGLSRSRADVTFLLDADIVLLGDVLEHVTDLDDGQSFVTLEWVSESEPPVNRIPSPPNSFTVDVITSTFLEFSFRDGRQVRHQVSRHALFGNGRAGPGLLLARKRDLISVQGLNSHLESWGWEDDDLLIRLQYALGLRRIQAGTARHLTHGDDRRSLRTSRRESDQLNFLKCCQNYASGQFLGTYDADVTWAETRASEVR